MKKLNSIFYSALLFICFAGFTTLSTASDGPLKVFILSGQSNMQGHAHTSTFEVIGLDPETAPMLNEMVDLMRNQ